MLDLAKPRGTHDFSELNSRSRQSPQSNSGPPQPTAIPQQPSWHGGPSLFPAVRASSGKALAYPEIMKVSVSLLLIAGWLNGVAVVRAADLPSGDSLIQRCIESEGGAKAIERAQTATMTGSVEITGHNISGPLEIYQQGDKSYTEIELPGIGKVEEGFDGKVAWESSVLAGARVKDGEELEAAKRASRISVLGNWNDYYKSAVTVGSEDVNGKPAWKVNMTPTEGSSVENYYFDRDSGLLVKMTQTLPTAMGDIPVEMTLGDYREVDGIQTPFLMTQSAMGQNMALHIEKVTYNAEIPPGKFDLPQDVKDIVAKKKF